MADGIVGVGPWYEDEDLALEDTDLSTDATFTVLNFNANADLTVEVDHDPDGAVRLFGDYENEDIPIAQEPQLVGSGGSLVQSDYENEDVALAFDLEPGATVLVEDGSPTVDLVLDGADFDAGAGLGTVLTEGSFTGTPPPPGECDPITYTVTLPADAPEGWDLTYKVDGNLVHVIASVEGNAWSAVLGTFYLPGGDLGNFCLTVYLPGGDPVPLPPTPVVVPIPSAQWSVDTGTDGVERMMWGEGDELGRVHRGPNLIVKDGAVTEAWQYKSPTDLVDADLVWLFGYQNGPIDFTLAAVIAAAGYGKYLVAS